MEKLTISDILSLYERYRTMSQMKPHGSAVNTFVNSVIRSHPESPYLTQDYLDEWFKRHDNESENTHYTRTVHLKHFLKFAIDRGLTDVAIPRVDSKWTPHHKDPVLMTENEIKSFFKAVDEYAVNYNDLKKYIDVITIRTIFRLLYSAGMRPNEARLLSVNDVDLKTGIVAIRETKGYHQHINVLCDSMRKVMASYNQAVTAIMPERKYFFQRIDGLYYTASWLGSTFSKLWHKYNESDAVVYGFRHHYAIVNINSWAKLSLEDSMDRLVTLSKTMGHSKLKHTLYYYSLIPQYAVTMKELSEHGLEAIIHKLPEYEEESRI